MARIKPEGAFASLKVTAFGGIGATPSGSGATADDMVNFRILADRSLKTRDGYRLLAELGGTVRGLWEGTAGHTSLCFAAAGEKIFRLILPNMERVEVGSLSPGEERVEFFSLADQVFLLTGDGVLVYRPALDRFEEVEPYAPLYGLNWHPSDLGNVHEPLNLLTRRVRVDYYNGGGGTVFRLPFYAESVDRVRVDGVSVSDFVFTPYSNTVTVPSAAGIARVEIALSADVNTDLRALLLQACRACLFGAGEDEEVLLYGGERDFRVWCSTPVSLPMQSSCRLLYPTADRLYFRAADVLPLGDPEHPVRALCTFYDRVLALHREKGWLLGRGESGVELQAVVPGVGCAALGGAVPAPALPAVINRDGVFLLKATATHPETVTAECISRAIPHLLSPGLSDRATVFWDGTREELWIADSEMRDGTVLVYNRPLGEWYRYAGIPARFFFRLSLGVGFADGSRLCLFDPYEGSDNGEPIEVRYQSGYFAFGHSETRRRGLRASVTASVPNGRWFLTLENERTERTLSLLGKNEQERNGAPEVFEVRRRGERHRFLRYCISCTSGDGMRVLGIAFYTNK